MPTNRTVFVSAVGEKNQDLDTLIERLKDSDPEVRTQAWLGADVIGAQAIGPLGGLMATGETEVARAAKRGIWHIVRYSGNPGSGGEKKAVESALIELLKTAPTAAVAQEVVWMLSEIGSDSSVEPLAGYLDRADLREDARMALERIPGDASLAALKAAFEKAPEDFKPNLAQSLRKRGETVEGYPCVKRVPSHETQVQPLK